MSADVFEMLVVVVVLVGLYRIGVLVVAARTQPNVGIGPGVRAASGDEWSCGRQGGLWFASWPFSKVVVADESLSLASPALFDLGVDEPVLDLSIEHDVAVRRVLYFTFVTFRFPPTRYEARERRRTIWLRPDDAQELLAALGGREQDA